MPIILTSPISVEFRGKGDFAYQTEMSVGADLVAQEFDPNSPYAHKLAPGWVQNFFSGAGWNLLTPGKPILIPTGVFIVRHFVPTIYSDDILYSLDVRPRSSLSAKGISASLGTIDQDYEQEILVCLTLLDGASHFDSNSNSPWDSTLIKPGERIGQLVGQVNFRIKGIPIKQVKREGGFGSTD